MWISLQNNPISSHDYLRFPQYCILQIMDAQQVNFFFIDNVFTHTVLMLPAPTLPVARRSLLILPLTRSVRIATASCDVRPENSETCHLHGRYQSTNPSRPPEQYRFVVVVSPHSINRNCDQKWTVKAWAARGLSLFDVHTETGIFFVSWFRFCGVRSHSRKANKRVAFRSSLIPVTHRSNDKLHFSLFLVAALIPRRTHLRPRLLRLWNSFLRVARRFLHTDW